jgi:hypothetical protein
MCPHTTTYASEDSSASGRVERSQKRAFETSEELACVLWRNWYQAAIYVSACCYICVLILLYMCPHTTIYMCRHTHTHTHTHTKRAAETSEELACVLWRKWYQAAMYVSACCYVCVLQLLIASKACQE